MKVRTSSLSPFAARRIAIICGAVLVASAHTAQAGINVWTSNGPPGGQLTTLAIDPLTPSTLYAGGSGGVFKSTDGGNTWSAANTGLPVGSDNVTNVFRLAIDPLTPSTIYAGIDLGTSGGVYKTTDGAATWTATGLTGSGVITQAIDPITPSTLYAATGGGVSKSTDGGATWSQANTGLPEIYSSIHALAIDPLTPSTLYAAIGSVFKSTDGGATWSAADAGLTGGFANAVAIDRSAPTTLYAGMSAQCYVSGDVVLHCSQSGVSKSTDAGATWSATGLTEPAAEGAGFSHLEINALVIDPLTPSTLYAATGSGGVVKSTDAGTTWNALNAGLSGDALSVNALAIDRQKPSTLYAGTGYGTDGGVFSIQQVAAKVVGTGTAATCTDAALNAALAGGGLVTFNCGGPATIDISTGTKTIAADTTIDGGSVITIGNSVGGIFGVSTGVNFMVQNLTITKSHSVGAIDNLGTLTVTNSTFADNFADAGSGRGGGISNGGTATVTNSTFDDNYGISGGAIYNYGTLTVSNSTFANGSAPGGGGGINNDNGGTMTVSNCTFANNGVAEAHGGGINNAGTATVSNSTFANNSAATLFFSSSGGGIYNGGTMTVTNSTFAANSAGNVGGAISNGGTLTVTNCTFSGNSIGFNVLGGGAIYSCGGTGGALCSVTLTNTIVANSTQGGNCAGTITEGGHNLDDGTTCGFSTANGSLSNTDPKLDPAALQNNGGPTQTIALQAGSPAIDAGDPAVCAAAPVNNLDQRGSVRPGTGHTQCSIGAYEADAIAACIGDCDATGSVTVDEILALVNIALGTAQPSACPHGVPSGAEANVVLILQAVNHALNGCG